MEESKIIITAGDDPNNWSIDVRNVSLMYLPKLLGEVLRQGIENVKLNPAEASAIPNIKLGAALEVLQGLNINPFTWHSIKDEIPDNNTGPFIGIIENNPNQIFTGLKYDPNTKVMVNENGGAMSFLTHWYYTPMLLQNQPEKSETENSENISEEDKKIMEQILAKESEA